MDRRTAMQSLVTAAEKLTEALLKAQAEHLPQFA